MKTGFKHVVFLALDAYITPIIWRYYEVE